MLTISLSFGAEGAASHLLLRVGAIPRGGRVGDKEREKGSKELAKRKKEMEE